MSKYGEKRTGLGKLRFVRMRLQSRPSPFSTTTKLPYCNTAGINLECKGTYRRNN
jgi:hypothetical protein